MRKIDLTGQRFGRLVVQLPAPNRGKKTVWVCRCDCGQSKAITLSNLKHGTQSCGCLHREISSQVWTEINRANFKHGLTRTPEYNSWFNMLARCTKPTHNRWKHYGGRGITVCDRWLDFTVFLADMGPRPIGMSIDRIDVNGNYEPGNCRWATAKQQRANCRKRLDREEG